MNPLIATTKLFRAFPGQCGTVPLRGSGGTLRQGKRLGFAPQLFKGVTVRLPADLPQMEAHAKGYCTCMALHGWRGNEELDVRAESKEGPFVNYDNLTRFKHFTPPGPTLLTLRAQGHDNLHTYESIN